MSSRPSAIPSILERIVSVKHAEIERGRRDVNDATQIERARQRVDADPRRGFIRAMRERIARASADRDCPPAVIAEIKRASPSKGIIRDPFDPEAIARSYDRAGATCLSVLTDQQFFQGSNACLSAVRAACELPLLRKDFIVDPWQVAESAVIGADAILLIVACLDRPRLSSLHRLATELGLDVLVEVHDAAELDAALELDGALIGINNRNLHSFDVSLETSLNLLERIPPGRPVVTESGVLNASDVIRMRSAGIHAFLIGEAFMRSPDPGTALNVLLG